MKKRKLTPTLQNLLVLFGQSLSKFSGESRRSYRKAFSSFQIYVIGNYDLSQLLDATVLENWMVCNCLQGLSEKTSAFYLDRISALYSTCSRQLENGREPIFKEVKKKLRLSHWQADLPIIVNGCAKKISSLYKSSPKISSHKELKRSLLLENLIHFCNTPEMKISQSLAFVWACMALKSNVQPNLIPSILGYVPQKLPILQFVTQIKITEEQRNVTMKKVFHNIQGEPHQWFAMRMRPKVKFPDLLARLQILTPEFNIPELFYPYAEIARKIGRKLLWEGKPVIRDVVFFKIQRTSIYPLFSRLYDLAWCFRNPGTGPGIYASIPDRAMEEFKNALGFLSPDFDISPAGEGIKKGDKVVVINGEYANQYGAILKDAVMDEKGNKVFRISLLSLNGHWDIGIDARLVRKVES